MANPRKVLIIDEDPDTRLSLSQLIATIDPGVQVDCMDFVSAADAIERVRLNGNSYALMLVDFGLGGGFLARALWAAHEECCPEVPFSLTSAIQDRLVYLGFEAGHSRPPLLSKPFDLERCISVIESALHPEDLSQRVKAG
jgi:DNA-binding NtrC family response regulator